MPRRREVGFDHSLRIDAPPAKILAAFFDARALAAWWDVAAAVATPRALGAYALEWRRSDEVDDLLGPLGGVLHGTVIDFQPGRGFFVGDTYWLPPEGDPVGPMALEVTCSSAGTSARTGVVRTTLVRIVQRGLDDSPRWMRYYEVLGAGWPKALETLKAYLEHGRGAWDLRAYQ